MTNYDIRSYFNKRTSGKIQLSLTSKIPVDGTKIKRFLPVVFNLAQLIQQKQRVSSTDTAKTKL